MKATRSFCWGIESRGMDVKGPEVRFNENLTLLIIAGGSSRRMGSDKLLLPVPPRGIPLIWHATERLLTMAARTVVVANSIGVCEALRDTGQSGRQHGEDPAVDYTDMHCIPDDSPGDGPLGGLATGLRRIEGWALTVAGDMPFLSAAACQYLTDLADGGCDAIVPVLEGRSQPLHALYHSRCLPAVENVLVGGLRRMDSFWPYVRVRWIAASALRSFDPELRTFTNVNTPAEWEKALSLLSQG